MWKCGMEPWNAMTGKTDLDYDLNLLSEGKWWHFACSVNLDILRCECVVPRFLDESQIPVTTGGFELETYM